MERVVLYAGRSAADLRQHIECWQQRRYRGIADDSGIAAIDAAMLHIDETMPAWFEDLPARARAMYDPPAWRRDDFVRLLMHLLEENQDGDDGLRKRRKAAEAAGEALTQAAALLRDAGSPQMAAIAESMVRSVTVAWAPGVAGLDEVMPIDLIHPFGGEPFLRTASRRIQWSSAYAKPRGKLSRASAVIHAMDAYIRHDAPRRPEMIADLAAVLGQGVTIDLVNRVLGGATAAADQSPTTGTAKDNDGSTLQAAWRPDKL